MRDGGIEEESGDSELVSKMLVRIAVINKSGIVITYKSRGLLNGPLLKEGNLEDTADARQI